MRIFKSWQNSATFAAMLLLVMAICWVSSVTAKDYKPLPVIKPVPVVYEWRYEEFYVVDGGCSNHYHSVSREYFESWMEDATRKDWRVNHLQVGNDGTIYVVLRRKKL